MTQVSKADEYALILPAIVTIYVGMLLFLGVSYMPNQHLDFEIVIGGVLGLVGYIAFSISIIDLTEVRRPKAVDITVYALLATLYAILTGTIIAYPWKPWLVLPTVLGLGSVITVTVLASELLGRLSN